MESSQTPERQCTMCKNKTSQRCRGCSCSAYCSKDCLKADLPVHKILCAKFKKFYRPPERGSFTLGILFPNDSKNPRFVWVITKRAVNENDGIEYESADIEKYVASPHAALRVRGNKLRSLIGPQNRIYAYHYSPHGNVIDRPKSNQSIAAVLGTPVDEWRGPVLITKLTGYGVDRRYLNIDMVDFRDVIDFFCSRHISCENVIRLPAERFRPKERFVGVRINCRSDQDIGGRPKFEPIQLPADHPVFRAPVSSISKRLELPIRISRCPPGETSRKNTSRGRYNATNQAATSLQLVADPDSSQWGWAPMQSVAGSVIVVREDLKPILPQQVEALSHFCLYILQPLFEDSLGGGMHPESPMEKTEVLQMMTRRKFENFYIGYKHWKRDNNDSN